MDQAMQVTGEHSIACAGFNVRAEVVKEASTIDLPLMSRIDLSANGPSDNGSVNLSADGRVSSRVGGACVDVVSGGVVADAGDEGNVGLRAGTAPMMQFVDLEGNGGSIVLGNGQVPLSPKIEITPDGIELSVGSNKIIIGPTGIEISGLSVAIEGELEASMSAATATVNGQLEAAVTGAMASLEGSGTASVKGAVVMIN